MRLRFLFEPRKLWVGAFVGRRAIYVALVPTLVLKLELGPTREARRTAKAQEMLGACGLVLSQDWTCDESPFGWCAFPRACQGEPYCAFCSQPEERK